MNIEDIKKIMRRIYNKWVLEGYTNEYHYLLQIRKDFNTASWGVEFKNGKKVNVITVGEQALDMSNDYSSKERLVINFLYHELGHSRFTYEDLRTIQKGLEKIYAEFDIFNMFEDCRMEHLVRDMTDHRFNWFNYVKPQYMGVAHHLPESLLMACKYGEVLIYEDNLNLVKSEFVKAYLTQKAAEEDDRAEIVIEMEAEEIADRVIEYYYPKILKTKTSISLLPVIKEWLNEFYDADELKRQQEQKKRLEELAKELIRRMNEDGIKSAGKSDSGHEDGEQEDNGSGGSGDKDGEGDGNGNGKKKGLKDFDDLKDVAEIGDGSEKPEDKSKIIKVVGELTKSSAGGISEDIKKEESKYGKGIKQFHEEHNTQTVEEFSTTKDLLKFEDNNLYDRREAARLQPLFERFLKNYSRQLTTTRPAKRLSSRNLIMGREKIYKRKEEIVRGEKEISVVIDCSGSMGQIMPTMRIVVAIMNNLSMKGKVKGHIILSSTEGCQTIKMPMADQDIDCILGYWGGEGLKNTFTRTLPILKKSEYVFVLTDGDLTDGELDRKFLTKQGVKPIGLYIGEEAKNLTKWFDISINKPTAKAVIDEMARKIK